MESQRKKIAISSVIFIALFLALIPVILSNNYLRQDDMKTGIWWGMKMSDEGYLYYNTLHQLVRPLCMILFFLIDLLSINMHYAVIARFASIINVCILGILLYRWQLLFNSNRLLAATFAIAVFTLPAIQLFAATANYFLIIFAILLAFGGPFYWYKSFFTEDAGKKKKYLTIGCGIFFLSFLDYPISSMYAWVLMGICYLNSLTADANNSARFRKFFIHGCLLTFAMTVFYFIFMHIYHWLLHVNMNYGRVGTSNMIEIVSRTYWIFGVLLRDSSLWLYGVVTSYYPMLVIIAMLSIALIRANIISRNVNPRLFTTILGELTILFAIFFMCYSPMFASPEFSTTIRYTLATMPMLLYVIFWSIQTITYSSNKSFLLNLPNAIASTLYISIALFGVYYANLMTGDGIVGPQTSDYKFIEAQLRQKVLPLLEQNKLVALHVIDCDHGKNYQYEANVPIAYEYGMRLCDFPHHLVGAVGHSLMTLGYISNRHRANEVYSTADLFVLKDVPWGNLIINSNKNVDMGHLDYPADKMTVVTIDMRDAPRYKHLDFYKGLLGMKT